MQKLKIFTGAENPVLRKKSEKIKVFDQKIKKFAKDLKELMINSNGLGIAAPQAGNNIRMIWVCLGYKTEKERIVMMINPEITSKSSEMETEEEGCLSVPGVYDNVKRFSTISVEYRDINNSKQILELSHLDARVVQHEIDHLEGILFTDKVEKKQEHQMPL